MGCPAAYRNLHEQPERDQILRESRRGVIELKINVLIRLAVT